MKNNYCIGSLFFFLFYPSLLYSQIKGDSIMITSLNATSIYFKNNDYHGLKSTLYADIELSERKKYGENYSIEYSFGWLHPEFLNWGNSSNNFFEFPKDTKHFSTRVLNYLFTFKVKPSYIKKVKINKFDIRFKTGPIFRFAYINGTEYFFTEYNNGRIIGLSPTNKVITDFGFQIGIEKIYTCKNKNKFGYLFGLKSEIYLVGIESINHYGLGLSEAKTFNSLSSYSSFYCGLYFPIKKLKQK